MKKPERFAEAFSSSGGNPSRRYCRRPPFSDFHGCGSYAELGITAIDRDRGRLCSPTPPTPPCIRVRTRRFSNLSPGDTPSTDEGFTAHPVPFGLHPFRTRQAQPRLIGWRMTAHDVGMSTTPDYCSGLRSPFPAWPICWLHLSDRSASLALPTTGSVGSEVARLRAGHRPPLKLHVRFSRMQLSRRV